LYLLPSFYKTVLEDLLLSRSDSFFSYVFSQLFSRKVKAEIDGKKVDYDGLFAHFSNLRRTYYSHSADGVLRFGPFLASSNHGQRAGYLAAHSVVASLVHDDPTSTLYQYNTLIVTDTLEVQWMEGKEGEFRRITRFDRTTRRPVRTP
jgi:hypothetical protein